MSTAIDAADRRNLRIGGYDQVVALSQANINDSLQYHYDINPALCQFEVELETAAFDSLKGEIKPPRIELIDIENADQAFYCLEFVSGQYSYYKPKPRVGKKPPELEEATIPVKGWKLAFYVDFAMKKMETIPKDIQAQIQLPGSYDVEQLLINFGTADTMNFNWSKSVVTGFGTPTETRDARDVITLFVTKWLNRIKDTPGNHNTLGYAVKVDPAKISDVPKTTASFPPTAVRLQTINHRPDGDATKTSTSNDNNAFLFTEMTGADGPKRMPTKDLDWSAYLFEDSVAGTMIMSRRIFWDLFVKEQLRPIHKEAIEGINKAAEIGALDELSQHYSWWLSDSKNIGEPQWTTNGLSETFRWTGGKYFDVEHEIPRASNHTYEYWTNAEVSHTLKPVVGTNRIQLDYKVVFSSVLKAGVWGIIKDLSHFRVDTNATVEDTMIITLEAVDSLGGLNVKATTGGKNRPVIVEAAYKGTANDIVGKIPGLDTLLRNTTPYMEGTKRAINRSVGAASASVKKIEEALNGQKRFVFPGAGTFDMKSPFFNSAGDLVLGLTYHKGEARKSAA